MRIFLTSTAIILLAASLSVSASAEGHKNTGKKITTKEQFLSLIDGPADYRLMREIKALNNRIEELASDETSIREQNDNLIAALKKLTSELVHLKNETSVNQLNTNDYQNIIAEKIQSLNNKVEELSNSDAYVRRQNRKVMAELGSVKIDLGRLMSNGPVNQSNSVNKIPTTSSEIQASNDKFNETPQSEQLSTSDGNDVGETSNDYQVPEGLIVSSTKNSNLRRNSEDSFKGLLAYIGVNHSASTTSYNWSSGADNLELDGVGRQSINSSFGFEYNLGIGDTTRLLLGFEFNPTSEDFVEISGTQSGNPGDFTATLQNRQSYYAGLGFVPSGNVMIYGKLSYNQGDAELKTNPALQNQNVQFKGFGYGAGLRTSISQSIFLGTEVMRINYEKESLLGVNTGTGTTNGKVQLGAYF